MRKAAKVLYRKKQPAPCEFCGTLIDPGTDLEDELSIPASPPAADEHGAVPLSVLADVDSELEQVFGNVGSLPTMVTPVCDLEGGLHVTPAECPVIEPPGVSVVVTQPSMVYSPAGLSVYYS